MTQMQSFIEKAKNDKALMAKLDTLGASGAEADKIVALAAEYGFAITEEDCRQAAQTTCPHKKGELKEEDLEAAAGGFIDTQNRYNPDICGKYTKVEYECVGFLRKIWCDHYREKELPSVGFGAAGWRWQFTCVMGRYDYTGDRYADPV